jgi:hypothetical protein
MRTPAAFSFASFTLAALTAGVVALIAAVGCSNQGEGDFCDITAGVTGGDCQDGLECVSVPGQGVNTDRCCPGDRALATTATCSENTTAIDASTEGSDASGSTMPEAAPATEAGREASTDAATGADGGSSDGAVDSSTSDGAIDSGPDGGVSTDASDAALE